MSTIADGAYRGAVLYADIREARRAEEAGPLLQQADVRALSAQIARGGGVTMEATPRRLLAFFPSADASLLMARELLAMVAEAGKTDAANRALDCRVVLGFGSVTVERGRLRSDWTHRLHGQVIRVPQNSIAALQSFAEQFPAAQLPRRKLTPSLVVIGPPPEDGPAALAGPARAGDPGTFTTLVLRVRGVPQTLRSSDCPVQLGRDPTCGVQVTGDQVSRFHGRIEFLDDKFHYVDASRNGSYVLTSGGEEVLLKRERLVLAGEGAISPGASLAEQTGEVVRYQCNSRRLKVADGTRETLSTRRTRGSTRNSRRTRDSAPAS
ncbi:MAG TPA: FHA domain-containing protein [Solimonas sp.]|nr:FHA domain-containing protein [Solimonas sp.]